MAINPETDADELLTDPELQTLLGISRTTIWRLRKTRGLPFGKVGKNYRYRKSEVLRWVESSAELEMEKIKRIDPQTALEIARGLPRTAPRQLEDRSTIVRLGHGDGQAVDPRYPRASSSTSPPVKKKREKEPPETATPTVAADPLAGLIGTSALSGAEAAKNIQRHEARMKPYRDGARMLPPRTDSVPPRAPLPQPELTRASPVPNPLPLPAPTSMQAPAPPFGFPPVSLPAISTKPLPPVQPWKLDELEPEWESDSEHDSERSDEPPSDPEFFEPEPDAPFEPEPSEPEPLPDPEPEGLHVPQEVVDALQTIVYFTGITPELLARTRWWGFQNGTGYISAEAGREVEAPEVTVPYEHFVAIYAAADVLRAWGTNGARRDVAVFPVVPFGPGSREPMPPDLIAQILAA
jgi:excisionase family DNA binding protein